MSRREREGRGKGEGRSEGVQEIVKDIFLQVIPQLIARIDHPRTLVAKLIHDLLTDVGKQHPQVTQEACDLGGLIISGSYLMLGGPIILRCHLINVRGSCILLSGDYISQGSWVFCVWNTML